jgi:hypothetical protein
MSSERSFSCSLLTFAWLAIPELNVFLVLIISVNKKNLQIRFLLSIL